MAAADLTVRSLRLRAQRAVPGLLPNVEDALRVSTKPPALLNRFVLVRRLRLRAAAGASSQTLAMQLERAWLQLAARAQPMELAGDAAEAVWAPSLSAARQMLLRRWLRGEATEGWFWKRIAPPPGADQAWPAWALGLMLAVDEEGVVAPTAARAQRQAAQARSLLALIAEQGMAARFVEAIDEAQARAVLEVIEATVAPPGLAHREHHLEAARSVAVKPRAKLLALMARLSPSVENTPIEPWVSAPCAAPIVAIGSPGVIENPEAPAPALSRGTQARKEAGPEARAVAAPEPGANLNRGLASPWSGLWLLLPLLLRHGLDDAGDPLAAWAGALHAACRRFRVPDDDPVHTALAGLELPPAEDAGWLRTARLAAIGDARLPLLRISRRHGAAWVSPERIDIEFPATSLDLRIRRAGFDIDPGFIPWLGRIVHFHYPS